MTKLATCGWLREYLNCLIIGPTGIGKSWLACALGHKASGEGFSVRHLRVPRFFRELAIAKGDGRYHKLLSEFAKIDLLVFDPKGSKIELMRQVEAMAVTFRDTRGT